MPQRNPPDWVERTPEECTYQIMMWHSERVGTIEAISASREEYIALKVKLAEMRGYLSPEGDAANAPI